MPLFNPSGIVGKGSLISFNYVNFIHDPYPLVLVTDVFPGKMLRGINLHYLTFNYIKNLLRNNCQNGMFSYSTIKSDQFIVDAFRSYKYTGVRQLKQLDCNFILSVMGMVRSFDPQQIQSIKEVIQQQLRQQISPTAVQMAQTQQPTQFQNPQING